MAAPLVTDDIDRLVAVNVLSRQHCRGTKSGFTGEAEDYCREMGIACSEDERRLGS